MTPKEPDPRVPNSVVSIRDFPGYIPNGDPHDIPPGAGVTQVNVVSAYPGQLRVRLGCQVVKFDS